MKAIIKHAVAIVALACCAAGPAFAEHIDHRGRWHGEIGRFHEHDADLWRDGRWHHGRHDGRFGWWWIVGGVWYFYPLRVDPYPDPYQPPVVVVPPPPTPPQYWYYCANPPGYYPYVARCRFNWQRVPATLPPG